MQPHASVPSARAIHSTRRPKSLFESRLNDAYRVQWANEEAAVQDLAELAVEFFRRAEAALGPIIGLQSVGAVYQRSLYLTRTEHPWLALACGEWTQTDPLLVLKKTVSRQPLHSATTAVHALLRTFRKLLNHLIGPALTGRLLHDLPR
jgi:hypothetical protein